MSYSFQLSGKISVITGGGTGLGFGISKAFLEAGSEKVIITGRREDVLQKACSQLPEGAEYIVNDVTQVGKLYGLTQEIESRFGPVDILVNNAGINQKKHVFDVSDEEFEKIIQTNLKGVFSLSREIGK